MTPGTSFLKFSINQMHDAQCMAGNLNFTFTSVGLEKETILSAMDSLSK
jgi:hypothetical protein